jgi:hypothetical protein
MMQAKRQDVSPMAVWWKNLERSQQIMQDNTQKMVSQMFEHQKNMIDLFCDMTRRKSED